MSSIQQFYQNCLLKFAPMGGFLLLMAKKTYSEMSEEEKSVIDSFEGEAAYVEVLANKEYYLYKGTGLNLLVFNEKVD